MLGLRRRQPLNWWFDNGTYTATWWEHPNRKVIERFGLSGRRFRIHHHVYGDGDPPELRIAWMLQLDDAEDGYAQFVESDWLDDFITTHRYELQDVIE